ncbi:hypothetical protein LAZ67_19002009 [Cordylochernes scorpioides]|uniref:DDE-1 domain-containing protein n=1 Tax=Cordylochernes scorpioides TaxID=51811 RepID=A0ABY6LIG0_9ARAC|nr:hypothetical protein LAZ67_19002009 [Cordylochernes scorpioides]
MGITKMKVLLFLDNARTHVKIKLDNVKLFFLPANCTGLVQPLDQGIIQRHFIVETATNRPDMNGPEIYKLFNLLDTTFWIKSSWDEVLPETIQKCFYRMGFNFLLDEPVEFERDNEERNLLENMAQEMFGYTLKQLMEFEEGIFESDNQIDWEMDPFELIMALDKNES